MTGWRTHQQKVLDDAADARARKIARSEVVRAARIIREHLSMTADQFAEFDTAVTEIREEDPE